MKITIDLENLTEQVESVCKININKAIQEAIDTIVKTHIDENYRRLIEDTTNQIMEESIRNYIETVEITVGDSFSGNVQTMTPKQYINSKIAEIFQTKSFKTTYKDSYYSSERTKTTTFEEFLKTEFNADAIVKDEMKKFAKDTRKQLDEHIQSAYDKALKDTLCSTIVDVIMQNNEFKNINNNIKRLTDEA